MAMRKELRIDLADIEAVIIECPHCDTQIRIATGAKCGNSAQAPDPLEWCPVCQGRFGTGLRDKLEQLRRAIEYLTGNAATLSFQAAVRD